MGTAPGVAGPEAADEPAAADLVDRRGRLRDDPRVAVQRGRDPRPDLDPRRHRGHRGRHRDAIPEPVHRAVLDQAPQQLVGAPGGVEADLLGAKGEVADLAPGDRGGVLGWTARWRARHRSRMGAPHPPAGNETKSESSSGPGDGGGTTRRRSARRRSARRRTARRRSGARPGGAALRPGGEALGQAYLGAIRASQAST